MVETLETVTIRFVNMGEKIRMVDTVKRYTCDACLKSTCVTESENVPSWTVKTEIGDLCPNCLSAWETWKTSFVERMRKESGESLI